MQNLRAQLAIIFAVALLFGCASGFKATFDHDATNNFAAYKKFVWISEHPMKVGATERIISPLLEGQIMSAVENVLVARGYELVQDPMSADFALGITIGSREEIQVNSSPAVGTTIGYGYPRRGVWGGAYYGYGYATETSVRQYTKGTLAIDVFDVDARRPVWHGVATKTINQSDRDNTAATVQGAVDAILAGFPPS